MRIYLHWAIVAAILALASCSSSESDASRENGCEKDNSCPKENTCAAHANDSPETVCQEYATAYCDWVIRCHGSESGTASASSCIEHEKQLCEAVIAIPGNAQTSTYWAYTQQYSSDTCQLNSLDSALMCSRPGTLPVGSTCAENSQCASSLCNKGGLKTCGNCIDGLGEGETCTGKVPCAAHLRCIGGKCIQPLAEGQSCSGSKECAAPAICRSGKCTLFTPAAKGEDCMPGTECAAGLTCDYSFKCAEPVLAAKGEPCETYLVDCQLGLYCNKGTCDSYQPNRSCVSWKDCSMGQFCRSGKCADRGGLGASCSTAGSGDECKAGLSCVNGHCGLLAAEVCAP